MMILNKDIPTHPPYPHARTHTGRVSCFAMFCEVKFAFQVRFLTPIPDSDSKFGDQIARES